MRKVKRGPGYEATATTSSVQAGYSRCSCHVQAVYKLSSANTRCVQDMDQLATCSSTIAHTTRQTAFVCSLGMEEVWGGGGGGGGAHVMMGSCPDPHTWDSKIN